MFFFQRYMVYSPISGKGELFKRKEKSVLSSKIGTVLEISLIFLFVSSTQVLILFKREFKYRKDSILNIDHHSSFCEVFCSY